MKLDELMPLLMHFYRKDSREEGPPDRLQTREFRKIADEIAKGQENLYTSLLYYFPLRYQEGLSLMGELPDVPHRVLDLYSRLGPFSLAAATLGAREVIRLDPEEKFLDIGASVIGRMGYPVQGRLWADKSPIPVEGEFDLIIAAYPPHPLTDNFVFKMIERLTPTGQLLLVDSSQPGVNKEFLERRDRLVKAGYPVQAPCVWRGECPALKSAAPCYAQREFVKPTLLKDLQRAAGINLSSLKMSYLIIRKKEAGWPEVPEPCYRVISPLSRRFRASDFTSAAPMAKKP